MRLSAEQEKFVRDNYRNMLNRELAVALSVAVGRMSNIFKRLGIVRTEEEIKSLQDTGRNKTWFKEGQEGTRTKDHGTISIRDDNGRRVQWKKIGPNEWRPLHQLRWEEDRGQIPEGYILVCLGDTLNAEPDNWKLMTRADCMRENQSKEATRETRRERRTRKNNTNDTRELTALRMLAAVKQHQESELRQAQNRMATGGKKSLWISEIKLTVFYDPAIQTPEDVRAKYLNLK